MKGNTLERKREIEIEITIKTQSSAHQIWTSTEKSVLSLKEQLVEITKIDTSSQKLIFRKQELKDSFSLAESGIENRSVLYLLSQVVLLLFI